MTPSDHAAPASPLHRRGDGRVVFRARRPAALVLPLAAITECAGVLFLLGGNISYGIVACLAPLAALLLTGVILRPTIELTREGIVQRQYPFSTMTRWDVVDDFGIVRAGNRVVMGYKLIPGIPGPRRQPAAALLRAAELPYDGGYFADSLRGAPADVLAVVKEYHANPALRDELPAARR